MNLYSLSGFLKVEKRHDDKIVVIAESIEAALDRVAGYVDNAQYVSHTTISEEWDCKTHRVQRKQP